DYNAANIEQEIRALFDAGLRGGYTTWLSNSSLARYRSQAPAFSIDYAVKNNEQPTGEQEKGEELQESIE
ncbi:MAG: hypothetical protein IJS05_05830, partial [Paludibacteraceae bacterium]|nr:hypothetical protein [Paludibacteraceae bacterium]